jgi:hypothetical protein
MSTAQAATSQQLSGDRGTIVISVLATPGGPVSFADFMIEGGRAGFADAQGRFTAMGRLGDTLRIHLRRIGFSPALIQVPLTRAETDSVAVKLAPVALRLDRVSIKSTLCPGRANASPDTSLVQIFEQLRMNAERGRLLAETRPHVVIVQRQLANMSARGESNVFQIDTTELESSLVGRYAAGKVIIPSRLGDPVWSTGRLVIPQLVDFAGDAFAAAHCFRFTGVVDVEGERVIRIEFDPLPAYREDDVRGAIYLDASTYALRRSMLFIDWMDGGSLHGQAWSIQVDSRYRDLLPGLPVLDAICARTTSRPQLAPAPRRDNSRIDAIPGPAAVEAQDVVGIRFGTDTLRQVHSPNTRSCVALPSPQ